MEFIIIALTLGFLGSFHCAGMCGPIAIALPLGENNWLQKFYKTLLYNLGRTITYGILGAIFGLLGQGLVMVGFQKWVSIIMGAIMVLSVVFPSLFKNRFHTDSKIFSFVGKIQLNLRRWFQNSSSLSLFMIGFFNGLLPCGLVYVALAGAIASVGAVNGAVFMMVFGIATAPMLMIISLLGSAANKKLRLKITKAIPVAVVFIGLLFILRGLSLGIPFLSPPEEKLIIKNETEMMQDNSTIQEEVEHSCCRPKK